MTPVVLPALFDLSATRALAELLRCAPGPIVIDGSQVDRIGVAGLQLLLSARSTAATAGHHFAVERPSEPLRAAAQTAGADILLATDR